MVGAPAVVRQSMFGYLTGRISERALNTTALGYTTDAITMAEPIHLAPLRTQLVQRTERWRFDRHFSKADYI